MLNRQKIVLSMLRDAGGKASRLQVTKWLFLLAHEAPSHGGRAFYQFVPYKYGPYSFALYQEADALLRDGYIVETDDKMWCLTNEGRGCNLVLPSDVQGQSREIVRYYGRLSTPQLLAIVYKRYPWFTINAEAKEQRGMAQPTAPVAVYTMGYEGLLIDGFLNDVLQHGIQRIIDVRANPISRRYGFHKSTLSRLCQYLDLGYEHFPEVGISSAERSGLVRPADFRALFATYEQATIPAQHAAVQHIATALMEKPSVLVCMEADPADCHRLRLANALTSTVNLPVVHLGWPR